MGVNCRSWRTWVVAVYLLCAAGIAGFVIGWLWHERLFKTGSSVPDIFNSLGLFLTLIGVYIGVHQVWVMRHTLKVERAHREYAGATHLSELVSAVKEETKRALDEGSAPSTQIACALLRDFYAANSAIPAGVGGSLLINLREAAHQMNRACTLCGEDRANQLKCALKTICDYSPDLREWHNNSVRALRDLGEPVPGSSK